MKKKTSCFTISFSGLTIRFHFPMDVDIPRELEVFLVDSTEKADEEFFIMLLEEPLKLPPVPYADGKESQIYRLEEGWLRMYRTLTEADGCQMACFHGRDSKNILYYPARRWAFYAKELHFLHLLGIEEILLRYDALLLHSSVVSYRGKAVLFSGPSGIGKSTQASNWEKMLGARIINGDRCVIRRMNESFYGSGSPWCGTSAIYCKEQLPIAGIVLLGQAKENTLKKIGAAGFGRILQQCIVNTWDREFMEKITGLIAMMISEIPVYRLDCRPDKEAVDLVKTALFDGE